MVDAKNHEVKKTSAGTWLVAVIGALGLSDATYHQLRQGVDAEKAAAIAGQKKAEQQLRDGTYQFASKFGPNTSPSPNPSAAAKAEPAAKEETVATESPLKEIQTTEKPSG